MTDNTPSPMSTARATRISAPLRELGIVALLLVAAVLGWGWYDTRSQLAATREEVATRLREATSDVRESRVVAKEALEAVREAQTKIGALEAKLLESQSQQVALESLYLELSRNRDEFTLAEIEQTLAIASQQLQLAGNVQGALIALQNADARLARSDRPQFLPLRKVIARDIERLKSAPNLDLAAMTLRLDQVIAGVDSLPLLAEGRPQSEATGPDESAAGWWARTGQAVWQELKSLVRVERLDAQDQTLLSPEQRFFLRENLKLRLMHARIALLQRDEAAFRADLKAALGWLNRYFDARQKSVTSAVAGLNQLNAAAVNVELPTIADSLNTVRTYKVAKERPVR